MTNRTLFEMWGPFRQSIIRSHKFYVEQAHRRLLSQFDNINKDADQAAEDWLEAQSCNFDPERHDPADFYERANDVGIEFYQLLVDMHERTRLSVVAGIYHEWDKQFRKWVYEEISHWYRGEIVLAKSFSHAAPVQAQPPQVLAHALQAAAGASPELTEQPPAVGR